MLTNKIEVTVSAGGTLTVDHGISGTPTYIMPVKPTAITVSQADGTNIVFSNPGTESATETFFVRRDHSILSDGTAREYWAGFIDQTGSGSGVDSEAAIGPTLSFMLAAGLTGRWAAPRGGEFDAWTAANSILSPANVNTGDMKFAVADYVFSNCAPVRFRCRYRVSATNNHKLWVNVSESRAVPKATQDANAFAEVALENSEVGATDTFKEFVSNVILPGVHTLTFMLISSQTTDEFCEIKDLRFEAEPFGQNVIFDDFFFTTTCVVNPNVWETYKGTGADIIPAPVDGFFRPYGGVILSSLVTSPAVPDTTTFSAISKTVILPENGSSNQNGVCTFETFFWTYNAYGTYTCGLSEGVGANTGLDAGKYIRFRIQEDGGNTPVFYFETNYGTGTSINCGSAGFGNFHVFRIEIFGGNAYGFRNGTLVGVVSLGTDVIAHNPYVKSASATADNLAGICVDYMSLSWSSRTVAPTS